MNRDTARWEHERWVALCAELQRMGCVSGRVMRSTPGRILADATAREADESNLMDLIRTWGDALAKMRVEEKEDAR